jgi:hypothetical protein
LIGVCVHGASHANASSWRERSSRDSLTGERRAAVFAAALQSFSKSGRPVAAQLVVSCVHPPNTQNEDYIAAFLHFSEPVTFLNVSARYRIDDNPVEETTMGSSREGRYVSLSSSGDEFIDKLKRSSKFRIEISLQDAKPVLLEFNTAGAEKAVDRISCGLKSP